MPRRGGMLAPGVALLLTCSLAAADPAAAEALFQEGRTLTEQGKIDQACEKFESSQASESSSGTLLNLADCRMRQGKTATAWALFVSAERLARVQGRPEHAEEAERRRAELEPRLSSLTLRVKDAPPGLEVRVNGRAVSAGSFGSKVPMDPGALVIEATAPGYRPAHVEAKLGGAGQALELEVPALTPLTQAANEPVTPADQIEPAHEGGSRTLGWVIGGTGLALLAAGGVFGGMALASNAEAERLCAHQTTNCPNEALDAQDDRDREALLSTIGVAAGLVGIGVGAVLILSSGSASEAKQGTLLGVRTAVTRERALLLGTVAF